MTALVDRDLEAACALEAALAFDRYLSFGIDPTHYAVEAFRSVAQAAQDAWEAGDPPGLESVAKALQRAGKLAKLGGVQGLSDSLLGGGVPDPVRLRELAALRDLRASALAVAKCTEQGDLPAAQAALAVARDGAIEAAQLGQVQSAWEVCRDFVVKQRNTPGGVTLLHCGLDMLNDAIGGLQPGSVTVIGAGTNVGKTSVALELMLGAARRGTPCGFISHEDPADLITSRLLGSLSGISSRRIALGKVMDSEQGAIENALRDLRFLEKRMFTATTVGGTELDVCAAMSRMALRGVKLFVVDYLQAIDCSRRQQDRRNEIRWLTSRLKAHVQRLGGALVLTSQLSRPTKGDEKREPTKHDLREAGDVENAAENVVLMWRTDEDDFADINVKLAKGKMGNVGVRWVMKRDSSSRLVEIHGTYRRSAGVQRGE